MIPQKYNIPLWKGPKWQIGVFYDLVVCLQEHFFDGSMYVFFIYLPDTSLEPPVHLQKWHLGM